jgi:lipoprotein-releasing system permease protein
VELQGLGIVYSPYARIGAQVRAVPPELYGMDPQLRRFLTFVAGEFDLTRPDSVLIGEVTARKLKLSVGDEIKLLTAMRVRGERFIPRVSRFKVRGVFSTGYQDLDKLWIYVPLETGRRILSSESSRQFIGVKLEDPFGDMDDRVEEIRKNLPDALSLVRVDTWFELEENQYRSFQTTKTLLVLIMFLIVLVACVNISSTMVMMVLERTREIGILKSMGASPFVIRFSYIITGFLSGILGSLLGISVGLVLSVNINEVIRGVEKLLNGLRSVLGWLLFPFAQPKFQHPISILDPAFYLESIPIRINFPEILSVAVLTTLLTTLASYLPARRAGSVRPLEVLRRL